MLLSIVGLVCLPLIAIQLWIIHQTTGEYQSSNTASYLSALHANTNTYNMQLQQLSDTALRMCQDSALAAPLRNSRSIYTQLQTVLQINNYENSLPFISEIAIYYRPNDYVLTAKYKQTLANFCQSVTLSSDTAAQLYGFLDTVTTEPYSANYEETGNLLFAKPVCILSATNQDAVICFLIKTDTLARNFQAALPFDSAFSIFNRSGEPVLNSRDFPEALLTSADFASFLSSLESSCELELNGQKQYIYKYTDIQSGNSAVACVGADEAERALTRYVNRLYLTITLSLAFMVLLLAATVYINYRPVKRLLTRYAADSSNSELSELELLDSLFFARDERIANQQNLLSSFLISDLLFGVETDPELLRLHFPENTYRHYAVAAVSRAQLSSAQTNSVAALLRGQIGDVEFCTTRLPNSPRTLFIFMSEAPLNRTLLHDNLLFSVRKITGVDCTVQLGESVNRIEELPRSHRDALAGAAVLPQTDSLPNENPHLIRQIQQFTQYITAGSQEQALASLETIEDLIASGSANDNYSNYHCYKLLSAYLTAVNESTITMTEEELEPLLSFRSPVQLFTLLRQSVISFCEKAQSATKSTSDHQQEKLRQYVNDNLTNSELCLTSAAEHMNLSIYAVSRLFKEATHKNFKEYITLERLRMAHDLLLSTDRSISEIASAVGFDDASYFSEVFKKHYHTVPTKFRSEARQR